MAVKKGDLLFFLSLYDDLWWYVILLVAGIFHVKNFHFMQFSCERRILSDIIEEVVVETQGGKKFMRLVFSYLRTFCMDWSLKLYLSSVSIHTG